MFMNDMFMNDFGVANPIIISMMQRVPDDPNARQVRSDRELKAPLASRLSNNFKNRIEASNQHAKPFVRTKPEVHRFRCVPFLVEWKGTRCPSLHSLRAAVVQSKGLSLSIVHRKKQPSRLNAALRLFVGSKEKPTWSNIRDVSSGTS